MYYDTHDQLLPTLNEIAKAIGENIGHYVLGFHYYPTNQVFELKSLNLRHFWALDQFEYIDWPRKRSQDELSDYTINDLMSLISHGHTVVMNQD